MRYILIILFLWGGALLAQPEITRTNGTNTVNDPNFMASKSLRLPVFADTSFANQGLDSAGKIIFSKVDTSIYIRGGLTGHLVWKKIAGGTGGGGGIAFVITDSTLTGHGTSSDSLRVNFNRVQKKIIFGTGTIYSGDTLSIDFANAAAPGITGSVQYKGSDGKQKGDVQNVWDSTNHILKIGTSGTANGQVLAGNNATGTFKAGGDAYFQGNNTTIEALGTGNLIKLRNNGADKIAIDQNGSISLNGLGNYGNNGQFLKSQGSGSAAVWGFPDTSRTPGGLATFTYVDSIRNQSVIKIASKGIVPNLIYPLRASNDTLYRYAFHDSALAKVSWSPDSSIVVLPDTSTGKLATQYYVQQNSGAGSWKQGGNTVGADTTIGTKDNFAMKVITNSVQRAIFGNNGVSQIGMASSDTVKIGPQKTIFSPYPYNRTSFKVFYPSHWTDTLYLARGAAITTLDTATVGSAQGWACLSLKNSAGNSGLYFYKSQSNSSTVNNTAFFVVENNTISMANGLTVGTGSATRRVAIGAAAGALSAALGIVAQSASTWSEKIQTNFLTDATTPVFNQEVDGSTSIPRGFIQIGQADPSARINFGYNTSNFPSNYYGIKLPNITNTNVNTLRGTVTTATTTGRAMTTGVATTINGFGRASGTVFTSLFTVGQWVTVYATTGTPVLNNIILADGTGAFRSQVTFVSADSIGVSGTWTQPANTTLTVTIKILTGPATQGVIWYNTDENKIQYSNGTSYINALPEDTATVATTGATPTTIKTFPTVTGKRYVIDLDITGADASGNTVFYKRLLRIKNVSGTVTIIGSAMQGIGVDNEDVALAACDVGATVSGTNVQVQVTGIAATNINWQISSITKQSF